MINAVLFDLDGTLLASDVDEQTRLYLSRISAYTAKFNPKLAKTMAVDFMRVVDDLMRDTNPSITVCEKFWSRYCALTGVDRTDIQPKLDYFYSTEYGEVGNAYRPISQMQEAIALLKRRHIQLCVATNCFFPLNAVEWRIRWAGLNPEDFAVITHYENMHVTKPNPAYYLETAALLQVDPLCCAMVGNHGVEDMVAGQLGMRTFLLDVFAIEDTAYPGPRGNYDNLLQWLADL